MSKLLKLEHDRRTLIVSGTMVDWINKISKKSNDIKDKQMSTPYGQITVNNDHKKTKVYIEPDFKKLENIHNSLGNTTAIGIEHTGIIYQHENDEWKGYIETETDNLVEFDLDKNLNVEVMKEENCHIVHITQTI